MEDITKFESTLDRTDEPEYEGIDKYNKFAAESLNLPRLSKNDPIVKWKERLRLYLQKCIQYSAAISNASMYAYLGVTDRQIIELANGIDCSKDLQDFAIKALSFCRAARESLALSGTIPAAVAKTLLSYYDNVSDSTTLQVNVSNHLSEFQTPEQIAQRYLEQLPIIEIELDDESEE